MRIAPFDISCNKSTGEGNEQFNSRCPLLSISPVITTSAKDDVGLPTPLCRGITTLWGGIYYHTVLEVNFNSWHDLSPRIRFRNRYASRNKTNLISSLAELLGIATIYI